MICVVGRGGGGGLLFGANVLNYAIDNILTAALVKYTPRLVHISHYSAEVNLG